MFDWAYEGVNFDLAGNGGEDCRDFLSIYQRITESVLATIIAGYIIYKAVTQLTLPPLLCPTDRVDRCGKRILLVVMCLTFGIELGFKFATKQMIYVLNPCHLATMIQIFCLAAPPSRLVTAVFRLHLHMLTGAPIAIMFPVVNTRLLPFEIEVYYIQHILMLIIPLYLLRIGGVYTAEPITDLSWSHVSLGILYVYHFLPLQFLAFISLVNLNNMLCPAVSDPFYGPGYRIFAIFHQALFVPLLGKFFVWSSLKLGLRKQAYVEERHIFCGHQPDLGLRKQAYVEERHTFCGHQPDLHSECKINSQEENNDDTDNQSWKFNAKNGLYNVSGSHDNRIKNGHIKSS